MASSPAPAALASPPSLRRRSSRSNSLSSSSVVTVKRADSFNRNPPLPDTATAAALHDPAAHHKRPSPPTPPSPQKRRRSSAAPPALGALSLAPPSDALAPPSPGFANVNRWSQSTTASSISPPQHDAAARSHAAPVPALPSAPLLSALHGAASQPPLPSPSLSPSRLRPAATPSPSSSPNRRQRPHSPAYQPPSSVTAPPRIPSLGTLPILPATVYDPSTPNSTSSANSPSTGDPFLPSAYSASASADYFTSRPRAPSANAQRPPSRSKADRILGRSPLGSPPIGVLESEARYNSNNLANIRPDAASRPSAAVSRDTGPLSAQSVGRERSNSKGQSSRNRSESNASSRLEDGYQSTPPRTRERREKDKKNMLSRALAKANTAVLLDNAQNFEGAVEAYSDACRLLQQVLLRTTQDEDRRKLDAIRVTYTSRVEELRRLDVGQTGSGKSLPARPMSGESLDDHRKLHMDTAEDEEPAIIETATVTRIVRDRSLDDQNVEAKPETPRFQSLPLRMADSGGVRESVISSAIRDVQKDITKSATFFLQAPPGRLEDGHPALLEPMGLESPMDRSYMPPPLSPRRAISPTPPANKQPAESSLRNALSPPEPSQQPSHKRGNSSESISWLDTIDESGGSSCSSSVHSLSPDGMRRKHLRNGSGATEAEFDAALDAAVEAAYDEGYEPYEDEENATSAELLATRMRNVELAKEKVREAEREGAIAAAKYRYKEAQLRHNEPLPHVRESVEFNFTDEAEEEERLLDEMTREYMLDGFDFDLQTKSSLPRQSDSSNFSGTTYTSHGSMSSHRHTGGTSLSTVVEAMPPQKKVPIHSPPPIPSALPSVAEAHAPQALDPAEAAERLGKGNKDASVRSRRLSGNVSKLLKIETSLPEVPPAPQTDKPNGTEKDLRSEAPPLPKSAAAATFGSTKAATDSDGRVPALPQSQQQPGLTAPSPQLPAPSPAETSFAVSPATPALGHVMSNDTTLAPGSPKTGKNSAMGIRKNKSSLSLKQRNLSISSPDGSDVSIGTPLSTTFSFTGRKPSLAAVPVPTPSVPTFNVDGLPGGGMHLFESDIHSPYSPGSPSGGITNAPIPLEPCPDAYLLRPFWLMRCFYQTIAHPRGGYLSTKLFVPRDVWRVKGVKLKNVDDKVASCDLLTAALQKLASVDTLDADAVLEEMNLFEIVLDQVQTQLTKKLGNEVGVNGVSNLFKDATSVGSSSSGADGTEKGSHGSQDHAPRSAVSQSKSYLTSWRKLRSKNSAIGLSSMAAPKIVTNEVPKDSLVMPTLPMTSLPNIRFAKRDLSSVAFEGPNATYMGSLARLFDAVQILDQIARQVEDPGLKHSSPTHVGLELSTRHAAEFFGFYVCRFVLADLTLMLDKFIKRGSEWVLV